MSKFDGHEDYILCCCINSEGLFTASKDGTARQVLAHIRHALPHRDGCCQWDPHTGECIRVFAGDRDWVTSVALDTHECHEIAVGVRG